MPAERRTSVALAREASVARWTVSGDLQTADDQALDRADEVGLGLLVQDVSDPPGCLSLDQMRVKARRDSGEPSRMRREVAGVEASADGGISDEAQLAILTLQILDGVVDLDDPVGEDSGDGGGVEVRLRPPP